MEACLPACSAGTQPHLLSHHGLLLLLLLLLLWLHGQHQWRLLLWRLLLWRQLHSCGAACAAGVLGAAARSVLLLLLRTRQHDAQSHKKDLLLQ